MGIYGHMHSKGNFTHSATLQVANGESLPQISQKLYKMGLIRSQFLFNLYIRCTQKDRSLKKGRYVFEPYASESYIADSIFRGFGMYYRVFLPEGYTTLHMLNTIKSISFSKKISLPNQKKASFTRIRTKWKVVRLIQALLTQ
ncbi:MAG: endolytic transglycosylase MltG [Holosporaceae bacterium]|nr:MAG: endolytic transglycosylase MltG [Holosporaceae bacterium]